MIRVGYADLSVTVRAVDHQVEIVTDVALGDYGALVFGTNSAGNAICCELDWMTSSTSRTVALPKGISWRLGRVVLLDGAFHVLNVVTTGPADFIPTPDSYGAMCSLQKLSDSLQHCDQVVEFTIGQYAMLKDGKLIDSGSGRSLAKLNQAMKSQYIRKITSMNSDGCIEVYCDGFANPLILDLFEGSVVSWAAKPDFDFATMEMEHALSSIDHRTPHYRFRSIGTDGQSIVLKNSSGKIYQIFLHGSGSQRGVALVSKSREATGIPFMREFHDDEHQLLSGLVLQKARWPTGGAVWLDSRGLLHLRSSNPAHSEVTLVLRDGWLAGWTSDGKVFGDDYYYERDLEQAGLKLANAPETWQSVVAPLLESLI
jgi:hypothetical protein